MNPLFVLLGAVDMSAAALLFYPLSEALVLYMAIYMVAKGGFFLLTGVASKSMGLPCMAFCAVDILTGLVLGAISLGVASNAFIVFGYVSALKGLYCFITPIFS